jgi:hypothetical protein
MTMPISFISRSWIRVEVVVIMRGNNDTVVEDEAGDIVLLVSIAYCLALIFPIFK